MKTSRAIDNREKGKRQEIPTEHNSGVREHLFFSVVEEVLEQRRSLDWASDGETRLSEQEQVLLLAWPLYALKVCVETYQNHGFDFLETYRQDPVFVSQLLHAVSEFERLPRSEWKTDRILAEQANACFSTPEHANAFLFGAVDTVPEDRRVPIEDILEAIKSEHGLNLTLESAKKSLQRIRCHRLDTLKKWEPNIKALRTSWSITKGPDGFVLPILG